MPRRPLPAAFRLRRRRCIPETARLAPSAPATDSTAATPKNCPHPPADHGWGCGMVFVRLIDQSQPPRVAVRQRLEQHAADDRKQCDVGSDAQRHDHDGDDREAWRAAQRAQAITQIARQGFHPVPRPDGARLFADQRRIAERAPRRVARLFRPEPRSRCSSSSSSRSERSSRSRSASRLSIGPPSHTQLSSAVGHITRATASAICFHCDSSTCSCFLPFSVSR